MNKKMLAYHLDLKRGLYTREYLDRIAAQVRDWGYNTIILEIEDKFQFRSHPAIAAPDAMSAADMAAFVEACRARGVDVIPLMQTLGHAECVVGKPEYAHLRESPTYADQYDPLSEDARRLIIELADELIAAMKPRKFFHIGGDETWSLGKSEKARPVVEKIGVGGLYMRHMLPIIEHIHKRGLRPMIWADICLSHPEVINQVPDYVVMVDWDYTTTSDRPTQILVWGGSETGHPLFLDWKSYQTANLKPAFQKFLARHAVDERTPKDGTFPAFYCTDALLGMGFRDVLVAPANSCFGDMCGIPLNTSRHLPNCFHAARKGVNSGMGAMVTSWAVRHCHNEVKLAGTFAAQFALCTAEPYELETLLAAFTAGHYGVEMPEFADAMRKAEQPIPIGQAHMNQNMLKALKNGKDPMAQVLTKLDRQCGGRDQAVAKLDGYLRGCRDARSTFRAMRKKAKRNAANLKYWEEGSRYNALCADLTLAALRSELPRNADRLRKELAGASRLTRRLFAPTLTKEGLAIEMNARYGFLAALLRSV